MRPIDTSHFEHAHPIDYAGTDNPFTFVGLYQFLAASLTTRLARDEPPYFVEEVI